MVKMKEDRANNQIVGEHRLLKQRKRRLKQSLWNKAWIPSESYKPPINKNWGNCRKTHRKDKLAYSKGLRLMKTTAVIYLVSGKMCRINTLNT